jgi:hypothetical protein
MGLVEEEQLQPGKQHLIAGLLQHKVVRVLVHQDPAPHRAVEILQRSSQLVWDLPLLDS